MHRGGALRLFVLSVLFFFIIPVVAKATGFNQWVRHQYALSCKKLLANSNPEGGVSGIFIASPQRPEAKVFKEDYLRNWTRDTALAMNVVVNFYIREKDPTQKKRWRDLIWQYISTTAKHQEVASPGEPNFEIDGRPYEGPWGRPQNDGPALRASVLMRFVNALLDEGENREASLLYRPDLSGSVIKTDLEYISHNWQNPSFDLWEEVNGRHYYTKMVQRKALAQALPIALHFRDEGAYKWYHKQAELLEREIESHWDSTLSRIKPTIGFFGGTVSYKKSDIDTAVILAILHGNTHDGFVRFSSEKVQSTLMAIEKAFERLYPINQMKLNVGQEIAIGRYPEDMYDGNEKEGGHPWVLTTAAVAELYFEMALEILRAKSFIITSTNFEFYQRIIPSLSEQNKGRQYQRGSSEFEAIISGLTGRGDAYLKRIFLHTSSDGSLSEMISKTDGQMMSARDLTWSYVAFITAVEAREWLFRYL